MKDAECLAANVARLRRDRQLTQAALAEKAGLSRVALGKIERAVVVPRARTLAGLAQALEVSMGELVTPVPSLARVRFRARARIHGREQILADVAQWLSAYADLEDGLAEQRQFRFADRPGTPGSLHDVSEPSAGRPRPVEAARAARRNVGLGDEEPILDICGLIEGNGVKLMLLDKQRDSFFGLSVSADDGGPAVVVNTWDRISVERWIFTAAHELGHLLLHPTEYCREATDLQEQTEREADIFASHFLMPGTRLREGMGRDREGIPLLTARTQGEAHLSRELQDGALPAGPIPTADSRRVAFISATALPALWQDAAPHRRTAGAHQERIRVAVELLGANRSDSPRMTSSRIVSLGWCGMPLSESTYLSAARPRSWGLPARR